MLLSGSRVHSVHAIPTSHMHRFDEPYTFYPAALLKHSRPKFHGRLITYWAFPHNSALCVVKTLHECIARKTALCDMDASAHRDTIARWL